MYNFKELVIWKEGMAVAKEVFKITRNFPPEERYGLTSQILRSAVSISSNIAEGSGRGSNKEFCQFLNISLGSCFELETQILIAKDFNYISKEISDNMTDRLVQLQKMINGLKKSFELSKLNLKTN